MKIFKHIQIVPYPSTHRCQHCIHFENDPALIETALKGLTTLSSAYASVRDSDGLCSYLGRYLSAMDLCDHFSQKTIQTSDKNTYDI